MHEGAAVHVEQTKQADSKHRENLNLKPHQLSIRFPPPTFEKVNCSQLGAVVLLPVPASFRGRVSTGWETPKQSPVRGGQGEKGEGAATSPPGGGSSGPAARWQGKAYCPASQHGIGSVFRSWLPSDRHPTNPYEWEGQSLVLGYRGTGRWHQALP